MAVFVECRDRVTNAEILREKSAFIESVSGYQVGRFLVGISNQDAIEAVLIGGCLAVLALNSSGIELAKHRTATAILWELSQHETPLVQVAFRTTKNPENKIGRDMFRIDILVGFGGISVEEELALLTVLGRGIRRFVNLPIYLSSPRSKSFNWDEIAEGLSNGACAVNPNNGIITFGAGLGMHS